MMEWLELHWVVSSVGAVLLVLFIDDVFIQKGHAIRHNFPLVGRLRYLLEMVGPELRQYWVANDKEEAPFNRDERRWVYASSKGQNKNFGFGTTEQIYAIGYPLIKHAVFPFPDHRAEHPGGDTSAIPCLKTMGEFNRRRRPFRPQSLVNISAMSFGSLGARAVTSMSHGAAGAQAYHNTGEGGVSPYHKSGGADIMWQLGTGYFGARDANGQFSLDVLAAEVESCPSIRCIEIKLSQGAKPGKGGILPGAKVTPEIAAVRGIPVGQDCISPNGHSEFGNVDEMMDFIQRIAERTGLPVGVKSAVGEQEFWTELTERMKARGDGPDFITIDGGEGGTGAAPLTFADHVALPFKIGFARVHNTFLEAGITDRVVWIGSGKLGFPDRSVIALAMGADLVAVAREAMLAIGCIQAQKCHTGHCPAGVATQAWWYQRGINIEDKAARMTRYLQSFRKELLTLAHASGLQHPAQFTGADIEISTGANEFSPLSEVLGYTKAPVNFTSMLDYGPLS
ncbi:MAG: FMN-binding glutamate synthase family protein [Myxococcota bacterium]|jgi:glutamate synthase (ferredoxin)|nr:FMN-binding glutamate synthase family protein [Myxococcota bacterium]